MTHCFLSAVTLLFLAASAWADPLGGLANLRLSDDYTVHADRQACVVYETTKPAGCEHVTHGVRRMSFVSLTIPPGGSELTVHAAGAESFEVRPRQANRGAIVEGETLKLRIQSPQHLVLLVDGTWENALVISARSEAAPPAAGDVTNYFEAGVHHLGEGYRIGSAESVYLAEGAIVTGSFTISDAEDVRISGPGMLYGGDTPHREDYRVIAGDNVRGLLIEGITVVNAPGWIVSVWGESRDLTVRDVTMIGNYRYNTDGVQTGASDILVEKCFLQCNDDNFSLNGGCSDADIRNNVLWNLYNGGVFMLGWGDGTDFALRDLRIRDNVIVRTGGCCSDHPKGPFSMMLKGSGGSVRNILFERIRIEELLPVSNWIDFRAGTATDSRLEGITLSGINIDSSWDVRGRIEGPAAGPPISGVEIEGLTIAGRKIDNLAGAGLETVRTQGLTLDGVAATPPEPSTDAKRLPAGNLLINPRFDRAFESWATYNDSACRVFVEEHPDRPGVTVARVTERQSPNSGLTQDVTQALLDSGPGQYVLSYSARAVRGTVDTRLTLRLVDASGERYLVSDPLALSSAAWSASNHLMAIRFDRLETAELILQSADDSIASFLVEKTLMRSRSNRR